MEPDRDKTRSFVPLTEGTAVGHYKIIEKIGAGGMGEVYLAEDTKLNRRVALKFLPLQYAADEDFKARFTREAQAAAALDHPNIITIHEVSEYDGQPFFAMQYVEGRLLGEVIQGKGLPVDEAVRIALQICEGLKEAAEAGIVHRDIKPLNIILDKKDRVKVLDFGLARPSGTSKLTKTGSTFGTLEYMSPEQAQGKEVDQRSDLFSVGVVLYEMLATRSPFKRENEASTINAVINDQPEPLARYKTGVPDRLQQVISKLLEKDPQLRYQSAAGVISDLKRLAITGRIFTVGPVRKNRVVVLLAAAVVVLLSIIGLSNLPQLLHPDEEIPSIAVLPFKDLSTAQDQAYFGEGIAEDLIRALTKLENLRVVARTSSFAFQDKDDDRVDIGRKLGVQTLLTGSVRKAGNRLRITAQLVNVEDGYHLWSERYDRELADIFAIQDDISRAIVAAFEVQLTGREETPLVGSKTDNLEAYNQYLLGRYYLGQRTPEGFQKALQSFRDAINEDPTFALAHVGVADCYNLLGWYDILPADETFPRAKAAAQRALEIDQTLGEAYTSLAHAIEFYDWNWAAAESTYIKALELNPGYASAHQFYAEFLSAMGRHQEAFAEYELARRLDPLSVAISSNIAGSYFLAREYDRALEEYQKALELDPNFVATHYFLGYINAYLGEHERALAEMQKAAYLTGDTTPALAAAFGYVHAMAGRVEEASTMLDELERLSPDKHVSPYSMTLMYIALGREDQAFEWLDKAYQERDPWLVFLNVNPLLDDLRPDSRFTESLRKMNLDR